jgi:hypothetical protein
MNVTLRMVEARGVEPLFPACYVQQRPRMVYQSHFRGEYAFVHKRGRTWMLLVLLLGASVWRRRESQYWTACFRDQNRQAAPDLGERDKQ